jgi:hypothetical protein
MTVEDLIKMLEQCPKTSKVVVPDNHGYYCNPVVEFLLEKVVISADQD